MYAPTTISLLIIMIWSLSASEKILNKDDMESQSTLSELSIIGEHVTSISSDAFEVHSHFTKINLSNNLIEDLPKKVFNGLNSLTSLDLSHNSLSSLDSDVFSESPLETIDLSFNNLAVINKLNLQPSIKLLNLSNNRITNCILEFKEIKEDFTLDLRNNQIDSSSKFKLNNILAKQVYLCGNPICMKKLRYLINICKCNDESEPEVTTEMNPVDTLQTSSSVTQFSTTAQSIPLSTSPPQTSLDTSDRTVSTTENPSYNPSTTIWESTSRPNEADDSTEPTEIFCSFSKEITKYGIFNWKKLAASATQNHSCTGGRANRKCNKNGLWENTTLINCKYETIDQISNIVTKENASDVASLTTLLTNDTAKLSVHNIIKITSLLDSILTVEKGSNLRPEIEKSVSDTVNNLIGANVDPSENSGRNANKKLLELINKFISQIHIENKTKTILRTRYSIGLMNVSLISSNNFIMSVSANNPGSITGTELNTKPSQNESSIILPMEVIEKSHSKKLEFRVLTKSDLFMPQKKVNNATINSFVIMARAQSKVKKLTSSVIVTLRKLRPVPSGYRLRCVFWDLITESWSTEGCTTKKEDDQFMICECNHLTNFALLMDIYGSVSNSLSLTIITNIGLSLSVVGLIITVITYGAFISGSKCCPRIRHIRKEHRKDNFSKILISLSFTLLLADAIFLVGSHYLVDDNICKTVAVLFHYFFLSVIFWSLIQSFYLYMTCVKVLNNSFSRFMLKCSIFAWGCPAVIVSITLITDLKHYGLRKGSICWIEQFPYYFSFLLPTAIILLVNFVIFAIMLYRLFHQYPQNRTYKSDPSSSYKESTSSTTERDDKIGEKKSIRSVKATTSRHGLMARIKTAVGLCVLLSLTWIFAVFAIDGVSSIVFQYIFVILASFQGFWIFIFHCVMKEDARQFWKHLIYCCKSDLVNNDSRTKKSSDNSKETKNRLKRTQSMDKDSGVYISDPAGDQLSSSSVTCHDVYIYIPKERFAVNQQNQNDRLSNQTCITNLRNSFSSSINEDDCV